MEPIQLIAVALVFIVVYFVLKNIGKIIRTVVALGIAVILTGVLLNNASVKGKVPSLDSFNKTASSILDKGKATKTKLTKAKDTTLKTIEKVDRIINVVGDK